MTPGPPARVLQIVVVEDHAQTRRWLQIVLERRGHVVRAARSLEEALLQLQQGPCDLVLSDIGLPDGLGWDLLGRACLRQPPFAAAMSGYGSAADKARSQASGFQMHLVKPFTSAQLDNVLQAATVWRNGFPP